MATAYLTRAEFLDQTIPGDVISGLADATIDKALLWASGVADSYLRKRYALPLVSWGEDLRSAVGELAQWKLFGRRGVRPGSGNNEIAEKRYDDAVTWFRDVAKGLVEIECVDSTPLVDENGSLATSDEPLSFRFTTGSNRYRGPCCDE